MGIQIEKVQVKYGEAIKINNYFLHSKYNPEKEAQEFIYRHYRPEAVHIIIGYGQGYFINEMLRQRKYNEKVIVIEPFIDIHKSRLENNNLFYINKYDDSLLSELNNYVKITDSVEVIISPNYDKINPLLIRNILNTIKTKLNLDLVNEATYNLFADKWHSNYLNNLKYSINDYTLLDLYKKYSCPVVVAAGGPSLTKQIDTLKKYRNNFILISAGSTINTLMKYEITPDYAVSIDGLEINYNHFKDTIFENTTLMYSLQNYPKIRERFQKKGYYFLNQNANLFARHLKSITNQEPVTCPGGGSVANYAFSIATFITSGPIALIGQDLAYTDNKTHADYNKHAKTIDNEFIKDKKLFLAKGYFGEDVLTNYQFTLMKENFIDLKKSLIPQPNHAFNCTEGGVYINEFEHIPFVEFCNQFANNKISVVDVKLYEEDKQNSSDLLHKLEDELVVYQKMKEIFNENFKLLSSNKAINYIDPKILNKMKKNDSKITKLLYDTSLGMAFNDINIFVLKYFKERKEETAEEKYNRLYMQSETLYKKMEEATDRGIHFISKILEELRGN